MSIIDSAIQVEAKAVSADAASGLAWGALGVFAFSLSFPMTRLAVVQIDPATVASGRALAAGLMAAAVLAAQRAPVPPRGRWLGLALVSAGVVVGFPLFSSLALRSMPSGHGAVVIGLMPVATAIMAVLRAGERPSWRFWAASSVGVAAVLAFAAAQGAGRPQAGDGLALLAVVCGGLGYAEGGALARAMGGARVICWALVATLPLSFAATAWRVEATGWPHAGAGAWAGFAYVSMVSMFLGFFAWYRGLAQGGVARVGQLQLAQPVLTLGWSWLLLGETVGAGAALAAGGVLASVVLTQAQRPAASARRPG